MISPTTQYGFVHRLEESDIRSLRSAAEVVMNTVDLKTGTSPAPFYEKERAANFILLLCRKIEELQSR